MIIDGIHTAQTPRQVELMEENIEKYKVVTFIELGIYKGGLSNMFIKRQSETFKYYGFEFDLGAIEPHMRGKPEITIIDVKKPEAIEMVRKMVNSSNGTAYILCDTFDKPGEMEIYQELLRVGDLLEGHDFPGEVSAAFLEKFKKDHPELVEINPDEYRGEGFTLWLKTKEKDTEK